MGLERFCWWLWCGNEKSHGGSSCYGIFLFIILLLSNGKQVLSLSIPWKINNNLDTSLGEITRWKDFSEYSKYHNKYLWFMASLRKTKKKLKFIEKV